MNKSGKILYKCAFEENLEYNFEYETIWGADDAAQEFLKYTYDNCDGWEWMPRTTKSRVSVLNTLTNETVFVSWELEFEPSFYTWEE